MSTKLQHAINKLQEAEESGTLSFSTWRKAEGHKSHDELYADMMCNEKTEEEFGEATDAILDEFSDYCESHDLVEDMDEDY